MTSNQHSLLWRARLVVQRFWQPTSACLACMPGGVGNAVSLPHWEVALRTGSVTGLLVLLLSLTSFAHVMRNRYGNALTVSVLTTFADGWSHRDHYGMAHWEALQTGAVAGGLTLVAAFMLENRAARVRRLWTRVLG